MTEKDNINPNHYKMAIQPIDFILANNIPFAEGNVIKYICRWKKKNGLEDLKKAKQYIDFLINETEKDNKKDNNLNKNKDTDMNGLEMVVYIKTIDGGKIPQKAHSGDACFDCYSNNQQPITIDVNKRTLVPLGFAIALPENTEAVIRPRSGLTKKGIDCAIGTVDSNYRGQLFACIINNSDKPFTINNGERICQLAIRQYMPSCFELKDFDENTERGANGFGSTGV